MKKWKQWILTLHLYGGLLCSSYLLIFGFSSLHFNHQFPFAQPQWQTNRWEKELTIALPQENVEAAEKLRDSVGLIGWPLPWRMNRAANGVFQFDMERPGKSYTVRAVPADKKVFIEARSKGFWPVVNSLHALMSVPNSHVATAWGFYTEFCTAVVLFASLSGLFLWVASKKDRTVGVVMLVGAMAASIGFILYVVLKG